MRMMLAPWMSTYLLGEASRREARGTGWARTGTEATRRFLKPAWISVSSVYVILEKTLTRRAASREKARNPEVASRTCRPETCLTIQLPKRWRKRLAGEK